MDEKKHGTLATGSGGRNAGAAAKARVFKRRIDCAPSQTGDDLDARAEGAASARRTSGTGDAAANDRSPPRAF